MPSIHCLQPPRYSQYTTTSKVSATTVGTTIAAASAPLLSPDEDEGSGAELKAMVKPVALLDGSTEQ